MHSNVDAADHAASRPDRTTKPSGLPFARLLLDDRGRQADAAAALVADLAGSEIRVIRLTTPLRPHLTLQRILTSMAGREGEGVRGDDARLIVRALTERQGSESRVLLLIEQAEKLAPEVLRSLQAMAPHFVQDGRPALQVMFVGASSFRTLLRGEELAPLRRALGLRPEFPSPATSPAVAQPRDLARPARPPASGRTLMVVCGLLLVCLAGAGGALYLSLDGPSGSASPPRAVSKAEAVDLPPPEVSRNPAADLNRLLRHLDGETPPVAPSSAAAPPPETHPPLPVEAVQNSRAKAVVAALPGPRVVIHVPGGSGATERFSDHLLTKFQGRPGTVEVRHVSETPSRPSVRYFHAADEPAARQVVAWMSGTGLTWTLQDFSDFRPLPSRGTVEVWLPAER